MGELPGSERMGPEPAAQRPGLRQTGRMTQAQRVYGTEHDRPAPGPRPGRTYRELTGGPLDGQLIDVTGWTEEQVTTGAYLITRHNAYEPGGRASYAPTISRPNDPWVCEGDVP